MSHSIVLHKPSNWSQALIVTLVVILGLEFWAWHVIFPLTSQGYADFRQLYVASYMVRSGHGQELYDYDSQLRFENSLVLPTTIAMRFVRPAYEALLFAPVSWLPYRAAYMAVMGVNAALLLACFWLLRNRFRGLAGVWSWLPALLFWGFYPISVAFLQGQDSVLLLTILAAALVFIEKRREMTAGILVGLGLFKFQIVIPIAILLLVWRRWRFCAGFAISAAGAACLSVMVIGLSQALFYAHTLFWLAGKTTPDLARSNYSIGYNVMSNFHGLVFVILRDHMSGSWVTFISVLLSLGVGLWVAKRTVDKSGPHSFVVAITAATFLSYYLFLHDVSILLIPVGTALHRTLEETPNLRSRVIGWCIVLLLWLPPFALFVRASIYLLAILIGVLLWFLSDMPGQTSPKKLELITA